MTDDYIRRQEILDAVEKLNIIPSIDGTGKPTPTEDFRVQFLGTVLHVPSADVVPIDQTGCKGCKRENNLVIGSCRLCARLYKDMYEGTNNG